MKTPYPDMVTRAFRKCSSCRSRRSRCLGWRLQLRDATAIEFRDFEIDGRHVFARIQCDFSTTRADGGRHLHDWQPQPCSASTCAIEIFELTNGLVGRHHHDLANPRQPGPVWHLQLGGAGDDHRWLDVPRWPTVPMDPVLVIELAVYSFFNDTWNDLSSSNPWRRIIKNSEILLLPHYHMRLQEYMNQEGRADSWLAYQCNRRGGWDPRPA